MINILYHIRIPSKGLRLCKKRDTGHVMFVTDSIAGIIKENYQITVLF